MWKITKMRKICPFSFSQKFCITPFINSLLQNVTVGFWVYSQPNFVMLWCVWLSQYWIFGKFHRSPSADILKLFQSILRSLATIKVHFFFFNDLPAEPSEWTTHTRAFFCSSEVVVFVCFVFCDAMFSVYSDLHYLIVSRLIKKHWIQIILFWNV